MVARNPETLETFQNPRKSLEQKVETNHKNPRSFLQVLSRHPVLTAWGCRQHGDVGCTGFEGGSSMGNAERSAAKKTDPPCPDCHDFYQGQPYIDIGNQNICSSKMKREKVCSVGKCSWRKKHKFCEHQACITTSLNHIYKEYPLTQSFLFEPFRKFLKSSNWFQLTWFTNPFLPPKKPCHVCLDPFPSFRTLKFVAARLATSRIRGAHLWHMGWNLQEGFFERWSWWWMRLPKAAKCIEKVNFRNLQWLVEDEKKSTAPQTRNIMFLVCL